MKSYQKCLEENLAPVDWIAPVLEKAAHSLLNATPGMAYRRINDGNWSVVYASEGSFELLGYRPEEITGAKEKGYLSYVHPSYAQRFLEEARECETMGQRFGLAYVTRHKKGWDKWVWDQGTPFYDADGQLLYIDGFVSDCRGHEEIHAASRLQSEGLRSYFDGYRFGDMIGKSAVMQSVFRAILKVADATESIIIIGESGTGKELVARAIHRVGNRQDKPFVPVNCGAIPENLMESELFGYRKGAFSGADKDKKGLLEVACGGTLFLDEVGEIPLSMQVKLLRALEGDGFTPMGGHEVIKPDLHVVAATNRNLPEMVQSGAIRQDFYYRINVLPIVLPPLRERKEDIPLLVGYFLSNDDIEGFLPGKTLRAIMKHHWPGNVRELKNQLRQYLALGCMDIPTASKQLREGDKKLLRNAEESLQEFMARCEANAIGTALKRHHWNRTQAALDLGIDRRTLFAKIRRHGLEKE